MKTLITITVGLAIATTAAQAQSLSDYQSVINGQSPMYYNTLDNTLAPSTGTGTFGATAGATFSSDYFGNANGAALFPSSSDYLSLASPGSVLNGAGTSTAVGTLSMLFYVPATIPGTGYYFSDSENTGSSAANGQNAQSAFALQFTSSTLTLKVGNKSNVLPTPTVNTWYYIAITYDFGGTSANDSYNCYLGAVGGTLAPITVAPITASASTVGDGLALVVGNKQAAITGSPTTTAGVAGGAIDELATWNTVLSSSQINSQFDALIAPVPEPSTFALLGLSGVGLLAVRKRFARPAIK